MTVIELSFFESICKGMSFWASASTYRRVWLHIVMPSNSRSYMRVCSNDCAIYVHKWLSTRLFETQILTIMSILVKHWLSYFLSSLIEAFE